MCSMKLVSQSLQEIGTTQAVFHPKPKERSPKDRKHMEHPHRAGLSFRRPECQHSADMTKAQKKLISVKLCVVPVTGEIFTTQP